jgi:D-serine deaminase-like pyridoxal phosphate-dependent protein
MERRFSREIDTPALLIDLELVEQNIARMAAFAREAGVSLRPHCKTHKSPQLAARQIAAGAIGITCQKLGEAEVMAEAGIGGLLVASQIVGPQKIRRLTDLARRADVMVVADDARNLADLAAAAKSAGIRLKLLLEVDTGMGRCGVPPGESALQLARLAGELPGLQFMGLMGYEGHAVLLIDPEERRQKALASLRLLVDTAELLRQNEVPVQIVSSSGTGTFDLGGTFPGITEIQPGSYATMDGRYRQVGVPFACALTVLTTIMSVPRPSIAVADAGIKSITTEFGLPEVVSRPGLEVVRLSEEQALIAVREGERLQPGDTIELLPSHGCTTFNLHDQFYALRGAEVEAIWPVAARGRSQ